VYYLSGLARQLGLKDPMLLGENGSVLQMGNSLPPRLRATLPFSAEALRALRILREKLEERLPSLWYQPNEICLTPFPVSEKEWEGVEEVLKENTDLLKELTVYRHSDSFDICPSNVSKENGVRLLCEKLGLSLSNVAAVGDGENDYSMFAVAGFSIGLPPAPPELVSLPCESITDALRELLFRCQK
jgi:HAD superfamily hydrolase (TIGR01484 family)